VAKQLWTVDAAVAPGSPVPGVAELSAAAGAAVRAGGGTVLDTSHVVFPNGAVTLVLILAESHLAIHTWPEENTIAVDLFSCGSIAAERVTAELITALRLAGPRIRRMDRGLPARG
jgi:S-adenosylmethionine decarboxylase